MTTQDGISVQECYVLTIDGLKRAARGRKLFVAVDWGNNGVDHFPVSLASFLRTIGADISYKNDGLHENTEVNYTVDGKSIFIG